MKIEKINCKDCVRTCCDNMRIVLKKRAKGFNPEDAEVGDLFEVKGVIWRKKKNNLWKCIAFDSKKRLCRIWKYRPLMCKIWFCPYAKKKVRKKVIKESVKSKYKILLNIRGINDLRVKYRE